MSEPTLVSLLVVPEDGVTVTLTQHGMKSPPEKKEHYFRYKYAFRSSSGIEIETTPFSRLPSTFTSGCLTSRLLGHRDSDQESVHVRVLSGPPISFRPGGGYRKSPPGTGVTKS